MTMDMPSSEDLIRRAKETLHLEKEDFLPKVDEELADMGVPIRDVTSLTDDEMSAETMSPTTSISAGPTSGVTQRPRTRRAASTSSDHLVVNPRSEGTASLPVPPSPANSGSSMGSGRWMRIAGNLVLLFVAVNWVLLLIGLIDSPDDIGAAIGGGAVMSIVPLLLAMVLRRAGKRRGIAA